MSTREHPDSADTRRPNPVPRAPVRRAWWVFAGSAVIALALLAVEHRAHVLGWLPWLVLLACPLMHVFMHRGHGHGGHGHRHGADPGDRP